MLVEMVLPSGSLMLVDGHATSGPQDVGLQSKIDAAGIKAALIEFGTVLAEAAAEMRADESELIFSVGVDARTGSLIAFLGGAGATASAQVRLSWKRPA